MSGLIAMTFDLDKEIAETTTNLAGLDILTTDDGIEAFAYFLQLLQNLYRPQNEWRADQFGS